MEIREHQLEPVPRLVTGAQDNDDIFISVAIGNGQIGGNKVSREEKILAKGSLTEPALIGKAGELRECEIEVETNILDVNAFTNMCVLTTTFYNQDNKELFSKIDKGEAPENGIASFKGKYILVLLSLFLLLYSNPGYLNAQSSSDVISFQDLETPASPGLILLDKAPSSIEKPSTPQGFGLSVLNFLHGTGGALEFSPFWLASHPRLTAGKMYRSQFPFLYNLSVSAASLKTDSMDYLAGGMRTRLFQVHSAERINLLDSIQLRLEELLSDPMENLNKIEELRKLYVSIMNEDIEKPVFTVDVAAALGAGTGTNSFGDLGITRWAAWLVFNYRPGGDDLYITALTRYIHNKAFEAYSGKTDLFDLGARMNYDISKLCLSLEYIQRFHAANSFGNDFRIAVIGSYRISENFHLTSSFGRNFSDVNNIIAMAGVNFGFSERKVKAF